VYTRRSPVFKKVIALNRNAALLSLVAFTVLGCGGGSSGSAADAGPFSANDPAALPGTLAPELPPVSAEGGQMGVFDPSAEFDVFACEAPYYLELRGLFTGTVTFVPASGNAAETCTWEASLQIRGSFEDFNDTRVCDIDATYEYTLTSGNDSCADGSLDSPLIDPLANPVDRAIWENPPYPIDLPTQLEPNTSLNSSVIPLSNLSADNPEAVWRFDGFGSVNLIDATDSDGTSSGSLFKR